MEKSNGLAIALSISLLLLVFLSGCASTPENRSTSQMIQKPALTVEKIITEPAKNKRTCLKLENLPKCANDGYYVITYRSYISKCIWTWYCAGR